MLLLCFLCELILEEKFLCFEGVGCFDVYFEFVGWEVLEGLMFYVDVDWF